MLDREFYWGFIDSTLKFPVKPASGAHQFRLSTETILRLQKDHKAKTKSVRLASRNPARFPDFSSFKKRKMCLTIIPRARMGYESIAHEAEGRMGYWLMAHEGKRNNCFSKIKLVRQK